jgi:hypothetical protein
MIKFFFTKYYKECNIFFNFNYKVHLDNKVAKWRGQTLVNIFSTKIVRITLNDALIR